VKIVAEDSGIIHGGWENLHLHWDKRLDLDPWLDRGVHTGTENRDDGAV